MKNTVTHIFNAHTRHWLMSAPKGVKSLIELRALARLRGQQIFGDIDNCDIFGHWNFSLPFLCFAIPKWLMQSVQKKYSNPATFVHTALDRVLSNPKTVLPCEGWCCLSLPKQVVIIFMEDGVWRTMRSLTTPSEMLSLDWICAELNRESLRRLSGLDMDNLPAPFERQVLWYDWTTATIPDRPEFNHAGWHFTWRNGWRQSITDKNKLDRLAAQMEEATKAQALDACVAAALGQIGR